MNKNSKLLGLAVAALPVILTILEIVNAAIDLYSKVVNYAYFSRKLRIQVS